MDTHHHTTKVAKVVKVTYYQVHGFNDDGLWVQQIYIFTIFIVL
jgi:hypothetical protein